MMTYKDELIKSMNYLADKPNTMFIGQQTAYPGNPMSTTILDVPMEKMIETPVFEEVQMGMSVGLGMTNMCVVTLYPRWDFLICSANQLINHFDKFKHSSISSSLERILSSSLIAFTAAGFINILVIFYFPI